MSDLKQPVWVGLDQWSKASKALPDQIKKAVVVALNRTIDRLRAEANRRIRSGLALKSGYVRDHLYRVGYSAHERPVFRRMGGHDSGAWEATIPAHVMPAFRAMGSQ